MPAVPAVPVLSSRRRAVALALVLVCVAVLGSACRTDVVVDIDVRPDGAGTVTATVDLDAEAAAQVGDPANLSFGDLTEAGWEVEGPAARDGGLRLTVRRAFDTPDQLAAVLDEIGGPDGVFTGTSLVLSDGFASSSTRFETTVSLTGDPAEFSDEQLTQLLGGLPLGRTPEELAALGADSADASTLTVRVSLPGGVDESNGDVVDGTATWSAPMTGGSATTETLDAAASDRRTGTLLLAGAGVLLLVLAGVACVVGVVRRDG